jgi:hypothetical protein
MSLIRKKIGDKYYFNGQTTNGRYSVKILRESEYRTKGEDFILIKDTPNCKLVLDSSTTEHIIVKTMTKVQISSIMGMIDEDYDVVEIDRGACVEFILVEGQWYVVSSDGLKITEKGG